MRRTIGNLFFYGGVLVIILAWVFRNGPTIHIVDHMFPTWVLGAVTGVVLVLLGIVIAGPTKKR